MRKPLHIRKIVILLLAVALVALGLNAFLRREPSFEGKKLTEWVWQMNGTKEGPEKEKARSVVRRLGSNSVPLLLDWLQQEDQPSLTGRFDAVRHRVFFWLVGHKLIANRSITSLSDVNPSHRTTALWALPELDSVSKRRAVPTLIKRLGDKNAKPDDVPVSAGTAYLALSKMAPESIAPLSDALSSPDAQVRMLAAGALGEIGPEAKAALPALQKQLTNRDPNTRAFAAVVLGKLGADPNTFLPTLIQALPELDHDALDYYLNALVDYKTHAQAAVPVLKAILTKAALSTNQSDLVLRNEVTNTLLRIAPTTFAPPPLVP